MPPRTAQGKAKALMNLVQYRKPALDRHGVFAAPEQRDTQELAKHIMDVLNGEVTLVTPQDEAAVNVLAVLLRRLDQADRYLSRHGLVNKRGELRPVATLVPALAGRALEYLTALGATPQARARLGLTSARTIDIAQEIAKLSEIDGNIPMDALGRPLEDATGRPLEDG